MAYQTEVRDLRVFMTRLRSKLEDDPSRPRHLLTETGVGYRLLADEPGLEAPGAGASLGRAP